MKKLILLALFLVMASVAVDAAVNPGPISVSGTVWGDCYSVHNYQSGAWIGSLIIWSDGTFGYMFTANGKEYVVEGTWTSQPNGAYRLLTSTGQTINLAPDPDFVGPMPPLIGGPFPTPAGGVVGICDFVGSITVP